MLVMQIICGALALYAIFLVFRAIFMFIKETIEEIYLLKKKFKSKHTKPKYISPKKREANNRRLAEIQAELNKLDVSNPKECNKYKKLCKEKLKLENQNFVKIH